MYLIRGANTSHSVALGVISRNQGCENRAPRSPIPRMGATIRRNQAQSGAISRNHLGAKVQSLGDAQGRMGAKPERRRACLEQLHSIEAWRSRSYLHSLVQLRERRDGRFSHELAAHCRDAAVEDARATPVYLWGDERRCEHLNARRRESDASAPPASESWALPMPPWWALTVPPWWALPVTPSWALPVPPSWAPPSP